MHMRPIRIASDTKLTTLAIFAGLLVATMGVPGVAHAQEAEGPSAVQETYRDWVVSCVTLQATEATPAPGRICEMRQELRQAEGNQLVLAIVLQQAQIEAAGASFTLVAPFGLLLSEPITIDVEDARLTEVAYQTCLPRGCIATTQVDQAAVDRMAAGATAIVGMATTEGQVLSVPVSLAGFTGAWNRLSELRGL